MKKIALRISGTSIIAFALSQFAYADTKSALAHFDDQFSLHGVLTLSSDYRSRGFSKSNQKPSIQGGIIVAHQSGAYLMLWGASAAAPNGGNSEADIILGYNWQINDKNSLDFSYADINYPGGNFSPNGKSANFGEYGVLYKRKDSLLSKDNLSLGAYYSPDYAFGSGKEYYLTGEYAFPVAKDIQLFGSVGYTKQESVEKFNLGTAPDANQDDYFDYKAGIRADYKGVTAELAWVDNNINSQQKMYDGRIYFGVTKNF
ncbi:TorF family putative porin [Acinetobacter baumannii]|uniref:TorF family putative porin n=1 Tax=Acinetobacter baumannii TaxID=470 RepID=UPI003891297D